MTPDSDKSATRAPSGAWRRRAARFAPVAALIAVALAAYWAGLPEMLSPRALGREQAELRAAAAAAPLVSLGLYVLAYAVLTGACLPVALMLSLIGGVVFGPWVGAGAVLVGATGGAVLTYAAARSAFAPALLGRAERDPRLGRIMQGFGSNAFSYLVSLRLFPFVPFAVVNVAAGLAAVPVRAFAAANLAGGAPTALIYSSLGSGLRDSIGSQESVSSALHSPRLLWPLAGLTLLSVAPIVGRWLFLRFKPRAP